VSVAYATIEGRWKVYIVYIGYMHNLILYHPCRTIHTDFCNSNMNVNKKLGKLIDAAQPEPPTVEKLMNALRTSTQAEEREACDAALYPHNAEVAHMEKKPKGTVKARNAAVKAVFEFDGICRKKGVNYPTLDACLVGLGKQILSLAGALGAIPTENTWIVLSHIGHMLSAKYLALCD
jgi:hypothetical protein